MSRQADPPSQGVWSTQEAIVAILASAAKADGAVAEVEREALLAIEHRTKALKQLSASELSALNRRVTQRLRYGEGTLAQACATLPDQMRAPVFALAMDLMLADGALTEAEADFVNASVLAHDLEGPQVEAIAEEITIKNAI